MAEPEREFKMVGYPAGLYKYLREVSETEGITNRALIRTAVTKHLSKVETFCQKAGFAPAEGVRKIVRTPLDLEIIDVLAEASKRSGLDPTVLTMLCLRNQLGLRLVDDSREEILARLKPKPARAKKAK